MELLIVCVILTLYEDFLCFTNSDVDVSEVAVRVLGNYEVDSLNDIITRVNSYSPSIDIVSTGINPGGAVLTFSIVNVIRNSSFTPERATFTINFDLRYAAGAHDWSGFAGNYTIVIVGGPEGGRAISCTPSSRKVYSNR